MNILLSRNGSSVITEPGPIPLDDEPRTNEEIWNNRETILTPHTTELLPNQYGFIPTGSTTAALVHLFHSVTRMLESCSYVRALLIDFTKAFDIVDHAVLMSKLDKLQLPGNIYNWIGSFYLIGIRYAAMVVMLQSWLPLIVDLFRAQE